MHYACDKKWWEVYYNDVKKGFKGRSYTINDLEDESRNPDPAYDLVRLNSKHGQGLGKEFIHYGVPTGGNSGFQAVNLAYKMGAGTIILLGFDMFGSHYFGDHVQRLKVSSPYSEFIKSFESITQDIEIINCTRMTQLDCFPKMKLEKALLQ